MIRYLLLVLCTLSIPCFAADMHQGHTTHLVRHDGVPAMVTRNPCDPGGVGSTEACQQSGKRYQAVLVAMRKHGFIENRPGNQNLVIYDVVITQRDGVGYTVRTLRGTTISMEVRGGLHADQDLVKIVERLDRASFILMNGAKVALTGELTSSK